jgi:2-polyprenyl-6-hydroxyphenyl methylase/3-demethylubiquinone-9 3-methyltransferase
MRSRAGNPENWEVMRGSILDQGFVDALGRHDIVYAWGVLHHTGSMWQAIANAAKLVKPEGLYYLALYNKAKGLAGSSLWLQIKRLYNMSPRMGKRMLEVSYTSALTLGMAFKTRDPIGRIERTAGRGMYWKTDAIDWLGGYPYEFATPEEVSLFIAKKFPDFVLVKTMLTIGLGNNWFLYERRRSR